MSDAALDRAVELVVQRAGLRLGITGRRRLQRCLEAEVGVRSLEQVVAGLARDTPALDRIIERVTVQESAFFRDRMHFDALVDRVLPAIGGPLQVWSAGCSNGQEPWSLAMLLSETLGQSFTIMATDLSREALAFAERGEYPSTMLRGLSRARRERWLEPLPDGRASIAEPLRRQVRFVHHNMLREEPPLPAGSCHVLFCRNVLIYAPREETARFLSRMASWLAPEGVLVLGASETLWTARGAFTPQRVAGGFIYRPGAAPSVPRPPAGTPERRAPVGALLPAGRERRSRAAPARRPAPEPLPAPAELLGRGESHAAAGRYVEAAADFRKAVYLAPDEPIAHLRLGFALEAAGDGAGARRAFRAARGALARAGEQALAGELAGWDPVELERVLRDKDEQPT